MRIAWFDCFAGIAGDMALGSLIDAGADVGGVREVLQSLEIDGWSLETRRVQKAGISATHAVVTTDEPHHVERTWSAIHAIIETAELPDRVRNRALSVFAKLAEAEARVHNQAIESVHFHEVGGIDAIVDIVGTCAALETLGVDRVQCSSIAVGTGTIRATHGVLPNPAPAVVELLAGAPVHGLGQSVELTTPTGAAIVSALAESFGVLPDLDRIIASGYGAGTRDIDELPNCTRVVIGEASTTPNSETLTLLETNVDDVTGEVLGFAIAALMEAGARDAWITPIVMKKGRPAHLISVLADDIGARDLAVLISRETGSLGVRARRIERWPSERTIHEILLDGEPIRIKVGPHRAKPEYEDAVRAAQKLDRPLREVIREAEAIWELTGND